MAIDAKVVDEVQCLGSAYSRPQMPSFSIKFGPGPGQFFILISEHSSLDFLFMSCRPWVQLEGRDTSKRQDT